MDDGQCPKKAVKIKQKYYNIQTIYVYWTQISMFFKP
jgi:hypothetical protein